MNALLENDPYVDFLILADRAEAINGKMYMMGGGWDRIFVPDFAQPQNISFGVGIMVPWGATNEDHVLAILMQDADDNEIAAFRVNFKTGSSPLVNRTESQRALLAFQSAPVLPSAGTYKVRALIDDRESKRVVFYAQALPAGAVQ